jgi:hypothetical protein
MRLAKIVQPLSRLERPPVILFRKRKRIGVERRIAEIDAELTELRRTAVLQGLNRTREFDRLFLERVRLAGAIKGFLGR